MKKEINKEFIKERLNEIQKGLSNLEELRNTEVINDRWLDIIDGKIYEATWELFNALSEVKEESDDINMNDMQYRMFIDYFSGRSKYDSIDDFIKYYNKKSIERRM